ncbi:MAG TPA: PAS domain S-box protein [Cytophagaceae bacterium]|nr:PAS domain S-box protein [Cytophagaceae bacterium]
MPRRAAHNESLFKTVYEHIPHAILVTDVHKNITYLNPAAVGLLEVKEKLLLGKNILKEIKIADTAGKKMFSSLFQQNPGEEKPQIFSIETTDKKKIRVTIFVSTLDSQEAGFVLTISKTTKETELLSIISESEKKYRGLFENAVEGIFILDSYGGIVDYNPGVCAIYDREDFSGMSIFDLFPQNTSADNKKFWKDFIKNGKINGYYRYSLPNGKVSYIEFTGKANYLPNQHLAVLSDVTEKRNTEKALLTSEANLKAIFDSSEQSIILLDIYYTIVAANVNAGVLTKKILGKSLFIGDNILNYVINRDLFISEYSRAKKGEKVIVERNIIGVDGEDNWIEFVYIPIKDSKGNIVSICFSSSNINNRKREAIVLEESEQKFRSLSENSPDIIYIIDLVKRKISYFNRNNILGYDSDLLTTSEAWIEIVYPGDYKRVVDHWQKFLKSKSKKAGSIEYRVRRVEGDYEWVSNRHIVIEWSDKGLPTKVLLNITIITDQIKAQDALKESEARLKALIENTNDLVWSIDNEFTLTAANSAFINLIKNNYKKKIKVGDNLYTVLPNLTQDGWLALHVTALKGKRVTAEFSWQTKKKENLFYEISYNPIYDGDNNVYGVSVFARDITQRKTNEATIVQTNFELDSFVYRASHDLRAPLRSILGLVNIINSQPEGVDQVNYIRLIEKSAIKLDNFISDLINFSRNSRASVDIEQVDFNAIINECKENLRFMESADKVEFISKVKGFKEFYSDPKRISIFLNNFLSNAIKYQDPSKKKKSYVNIQVSVYKTHAVIAIEDNGVGIKKEYQSKIFNMFFRASENSFGSGLGLYIARQAVERLGGEIKVDSKLGFGTTFMINLPNLEDKMFDFTSI